MTNIFLVEDDTSLRHEVQEILEIQGFHVTCCTNFPAAAEEALACHADCVLLDLKLPGTSGQAICRGIRSRSAVPVVVLTSSESEFDEVTCMNLGADGYLTKPYSPAVLVAHIQSVLRRANSAPSRVLFHNGLSVDLARSTATFGESSAELTKNELRILALLMANPGCIISRQELMLELWESDSFIDDNTLTVNVNRLRAKLEELGVPTDYVRTKRGQGYSV